MKIAITGASGFIGRHVLKKLADYSLDVVCMTRNASQFDDMEHDYQIVEMDINHFKYNAYDALMRPDVLIHLAWNGLPNYQSLHHFEKELPAQYRFLSNLIYNGLPSLVVTGTCFEYGMQSGLLTETMNTAPTNPYGYAKDALRQQLSFLRSTHPFNLSWIRLFYMYGEGQPKTSLFTKLKDAANRGDIEFDMSGGQQLRDFRKVEDIAHDIVKLALARKNIDIVNVCSGIPISIRSLVEGWITENGWDIRLNLGKLPYPEYEPMAFWGDRSKFNSIIREK